MSIAMKVLVNALHLRPKPLASAEAIAKEVDHDRTDADVPRTLKRSHDVVRTSVEGLPVITLTPKGNSPVGELLYIHGGAYVHPLVKPHWKIIERLVADNSMRVTVPLYELAPEHHGDEAFPKLHQVYDTTVATGLPLVIAGDSAGGALVMACTIRARDENKIAPTAVLLFSPWVDASMSNPGIAAIQPRDPMLGRDGLIWAAQKWAGTRPASDPWISPINDTLEDLPQIAVFQGGIDIFAPDVQHFADKANAAGTSTEFHFYPDAFHVFVGVPQLSESRGALTRASAIIKNATTA